MTDQPSLFGDDGEPEDPGPVLWETPPELVPRDHRREHGLTIQEQFERFHEANPWVLEALERLALDLYRRGRRFGVSMLFEVLRWQFLRVTIDETADFRLNNNYKSRYARLLITRHPELAEVVELRRLRAA